jgi:predicted small lipoprotein YifL
MGRRMLCALLAALLLAGLTACGGKAPAEEDVTEEARSRSGRNRCRSPRPAFPPGPTP